MASLNQGNWLAATVLIFWPIASLALYATLPPKLATIWVILAGYLILPFGVSIKVPMIPAFDKDLIPSVCAWVGALTYLRTKQFGPKSSLTLVALLAGFFLGPLITSVLNGDPVVRGDVFIPGVGLYDGFSTVFSQMGWFAPFLLGWRFFDQENDVQNLLRALTIGGLLYSIPVLFEVRFSPQLAQWLYGYSGSFFGVEVRYGGYRPVVFLQNGLATAFFMATAFLASLTLTGAELRYRISGSVSVLLGVLVLFCKSAGALIHSALGLVVLKWLPLKAQTQVAVLLVTIALLYPTLRLFDLFPTDALVSVVASVSDERAESLNFRFLQEQNLLKHANERFAFGWGRYARNRVYSEEFSKDESVTDGFWIIVLGQFGIVGFLATFGLLTLPVFRATRALRISPAGSGRTALAGLTLLLALTVVEQLPNASVSSWTWFLAGTLLGRSEFLFQSRFAGHRKHA